MGEERRRYHGFNLPLTPRLLLVLSIGAVFVSFVVTHLARVETIRRLETRQSARVQEVARSLASRAAPLLAARDDLRLSMISASAAQFGRYRVLVLDADGRVRIDTGMGHGGESMQILTAEGAFHRPWDQERHEYLAPAIGLSGLVGEVRIRYPVNIAAMVEFSPSLFGGCLLACATLLVAAGLVCHHWSSHVREAVTVAHRLGHGELTAHCERRAGGAIRDLQEGLHDLGRVLGAGAQQVEQGFLELAYQAVEVLERRGGKVGHGDRTWTYSARLAKRLGLSEEECRDIEIAARLHDLGEIYEPPLPATAADPDEDAVRRMRRTPQRGAELLEGVSNLRRAAEIVRHHREKFNGAGFPHGLAGERIPLGARVVGIADAYDQLTTIQRGQRGPLGWPDALDTLREDRGETFDPWLVDLFEEEIRKSPIPQRTLEPVMISASGVAPYKAAAGAVRGLDDDLPPGWGRVGDEELEVLGDDPTGEST